MRHEFTQLETIDKPITYFELIRVQKNKKISYNS